MSAIEGYDREPATFANLSAEQVLKLKSATDLVIIGVLALLSVWSVRPLLEEWGFMAAFRAQGIGYLGTIWSLIALRPLHILPPIGQWFLGAGHPIGYGIFAAVLVVARYIVCKWAVSPVLSSREATLFATLATVFVGWNGQWLSRFNPAQLSAIIFFVMLGLCLRAFDRKSVANALFIATSVIAMLMTYQALALCTLTLPALAFFARSDVDLRRRYYGLAVSAISIVAGFFGYLAYSVLISNLLVGTYEQGVISSLLSGSFLVSIGGFIAAAYKSAYFAQPLLLPIFIVIASICVVGADGNHAKRFKECLVWGLCIALLPLSSLVYLNQGHLNDPERVLFPTSVAFCLVVFFGLVRSSGRAVNFRTSGVICCAILFACVSAAEARREWNFQTNIIEQLQDISSQPGGKDIVLVDETGLLGDVYTFLINSLTSAMSGLGTPVNVEICTLDNVDRLHDIARRYPIPTTPRCSDIDFGSRLPVFAALSGSNVVLSSRQ